MDKNEEKTYQPQEDRILQGSAQGSSIVPAGLASSSDNGLSPTLPTNGPEHAIVEEVQGERRTDSLVPELPVTEKAEISEKKDVTLEMATKKKVGRNTLPEKSYRVGEDKDTETASTVSEGMAIECDEIRATKRKKSHSADRHSSEESEDEALKRAKVSRKHKIITDDPTTSLMLIKQSRSDPDLSIRPSEEDMRIVRMKKGYISKQKRLEIEEAKEEIAWEKVEENRRKKEERNKAEEERRKKEERIKAENNILAKINARPAAEKEYIGNMTASDLAAMALEYLEHVETIRTKCGTMQGALSGELKRRKISLDNMVKALQAKAEENGDPIFLKAKIDELIKKNRKEEKRKTKEINELKELVNGVMKENKEMKRELNLIREDIKRRDRKQDEIAEKKEVKKKSYQKKEEETYTYQNDEVRVNPTLYTSTSSMVMVQ